ncbi:MAG: T9SS type A sorting domain-containing protein [Flavobacteriales bacterium]|nr:T9SS type A sorting domain-containing protein [Flavobacteriales bacterium]
MKFKLMLICLSLLLSGIVIAQTCTGHSDAERFYTSPAIKEIVTKGVFDEEKLGEISRCEGFFNYPALVDYLNENDETNKTQNGFKSETELNGIVVLPVNAVYENEAIRAELINTKTTTLFRFESGNRYELIKHAYVIKDTEGNTLNTFSESWWVCKTTGAYRHSVCTDATDFTNENRLVFELYPNPASERVFIKILSATASENFTASIITSDGKSTGITGSVKYFNQVNEAISLNTAQLLPGIYWVSLTDGINLTTKKLIIQ